MMRFREFLNSESSKAIQAGTGGDGFIARALSKQVKSPMGSGNVIGKMISSGPKLTKPARPTGIASLRGPLTIPSVL